MRATGRYRRGLSQALQWFFVLASAGSTALAYDWPVRPRIGQHVITATLGEYRSALGNTPAHFHNGVDIGEDGVEVRAIEAGVAYRGNSSVAMGHFRYVHLSNIAVTWNPEYYEAGQLLGLSDDHLHLGECDMVLTTTDPQQLPPPGGHWLNPLREGGLTPFDDFAQPIIHEARVYRQGTTTQLQGDSLVHLHGPVDVWVNARDHRTAASGDSVPGVYYCGVYQLSVEFRRGETQIGNTIAYHIYDQCPSNASLGAAYAGGSSTSGPLLYWATNDPFDRPYNKYWNTRQQTDEAYNVDAQFNADALYPDGPIEIRVIAADIRGNESQPYIITIP